MATAAALTCGTLGHGAWGASRPPVQQAPAVIATGAGYLVAPLENHSPSVGLSWIGPALAFTLAERLEALPRLRPAYGPRVLDLPALRQAGEQAIGQRALEGGAEWVFAGWFNRVEWKYQVGLRLYRVEGGALRQVAESEAKAESGAAGVAGVLELLDRAMLDVLGQAGLVEGEAPRPLLRRPTRDAYALTLFGRALISYLREGADRAELEKAQKILQRVCFIDPRFAEAHRVLGLLELELGEAGKAQGQYAYALDLRPDYFAALAGLGQLYRQAGNRGRAEEVIGKALKVRPWDVDTRLALGEVLWEGGRLPEAQAELRRVVAERPDHLVARRTLALVYAAQGQVAELAAELGRVTELAPDDIEVWLDLAAAHQRLGQTKQAMAAYEEVLRRRPRHAETHRLLGDLYRGAGEYERAVDLYRRMARLAPDDPRPYFLLSATYREMGQIVKAEAALQDAQQFRRYLGEAWAGLGALALLRNDLARANWYLSRAAARPGTASRPRVRYNYALVLDRLGEPEHALAELRAAAELDPQDAEIDFAEGAILLRQRRVDEARQALSAALQLRPDHAGAQQALSLLGPTPAPSRP